MSEIVERTPVDQFRERLRQARDTADWGAALYWDARLRLNTASGAENIPYGPLNRPSGFRQPDFRQMTDIGETVYMNDYASYRQYDRKRAQGGRKTSKRQRLNQIIAAQTQQIRLSFKNIITAEADVGFRAVVLRNGGAASPTINAYEFPLHIYPLFNCCQSDTGLATDILKDQSAQFAKVG